MKKMNDWEKVEGSVSPLGATWIEEEQAYNFALYSKNATRVTLYFYTDDNFQHPYFEYEFDYLTNKSGPIWHCRISAEKLGTVKYYAYRVDGPLPENQQVWHHFDFEKLLLDPYSRGVFFPPKFNRDKAMQPGNNEGEAALGILSRQAQAFDWGDDAGPGHASDLVIYELHIRGFTRHASSGVKEENRGKFAGVVEMIPYLQELGITAVELMPVFQYDPQNGNYWGYMPMNFFSPHTSYAVHPEASRQMIEFKEMVKALHQAGIEVILDVVYNHTCEGDHRGPNYSFKGIDNTTYFIMSGDPKAPWANYSGTGNTLHTANRAVRELIVDSMRYWVREMHVDGFRFDLASIFTRNSDGSINPDDPPIFGQIASDEELSKVRLIAEPWDAGGLYQLGRRFPGVRWLQWNGAYRDSIQRFVRGDSGLVPEVMRRLYGSDDLFPDDRFYALRPFQSINYITSHDGFSLYDLVSYNQKRNWANGENNRDGTEDYSWNCGWEGDDLVPDRIMRLRKQQVKNFCCLLMLSNGVPMFRMGDEFLQTQRGNNNPYNQDNETSWLNWNRLRMHEDSFRFSKLMIAFRKAHPSLGRSRFWREDVRWYGVSHTPDTSHDSHTIAFCLHGASQNDVDIYVMINAYWEDLRFGIQEGKPQNWLRVVDTALPSPHDICEQGKEQPVSSPYYNVKARSVVVLIRKSAE